ncbi:unnamed protein product [Nezara viridula]|uniref:Uncharacterized protein n=1 Tax=Nezara viridula TaxID=85310 RepID=A0A9P0MVT3_NEZVI|nr:unnamed protein product [Nezara viridula]
MKAPLPRNTKRPPRNRWRPGSWDQPTRLTDCSHLHTLYGSDTVLHHPRRRHPFSLPAAPEGLLHLLVPVCRAGVSITHCSLRYQSINCLVSLLFIPPDYMSDKATKQRRTRQCFTQGQKKEIETNLQRDLGMADKNPWAVSAKSGAIHQQGRTIGQSDAVSPARS